MSLLRAAELATVTTILLCNGASEAPALVGVPGGAQAPSSTQAGGSEFGVAPSAASIHPVLSELSAQASSGQGRPPRVTLRVEETGVATVYLQVLIKTASAHPAVVVSANMGWVHTGRRLTVAWPGAARLSAGTYQISVVGHDRRWAALVGRARSSAVARLVVRSPAPSTTVAPAPRPAPSPAAGVPTPAQSAALGAVFPVAGPHNFGGPEDRYGAPREGHIHEGQDVLTAEGTPVVVPLAGTILTTSYQAEGAGYYAVEHTSVGFDFMFAHCQAGSFAVSTGESVSAGHALCRAGQTGDATAPHLHFEMWVGGWQASAGHSIDPLPYLEAWEHAGPGG